MWRKSCAPSCPIIAASDIGDTTVTPNNGNCFRISLSIYYYSSVLLVNGDVLMNALTSHNLNELGSSTLDEEQIITLKHNFTAAKELELIIRRISNSGLAFIDNNSLWWICNYSSK